jgi:hypothetical protein
VNTMNQPQPMTGQQLQPLQQAAQMIQQAQALEAQEQLTRMGVSNVSQQFSKAEQSLQQVLQEFQLMQNQILTQTDAQQRQIVNIQQRIMQSIDQIRAVENTIASR